MTRDDFGVGDAYKELTKAEQQATALEKLLDQLDAKMDSILKEAEDVKSELKDTGIEEEPKKN